MSARRKHRCVEFAARWLTGNCSGVDAARRGHRNRSRMATGPRKARRPVQDAVRGAILGRLSHFESRHGRIAATCWISNCRRLAPNLPRIAGQRLAFGRNLRRIGRIDRQIRPIVFYVVHLVFRTPSATCSDCFSNRLCKTRGHASNERLAFKPTCTAVNFFHT
jgi:hypothetical protein